MQEGALVKYHLGDLLKFLKEDDQPVFFETIPDRLHLQPGESESFTVYFIPVQPGVYYGEFKIHAFGRQLHQFTILGAATQMTVFPTVVSKHHRSQGGRSSGSNHLETSGSKVSQRVRNREGSVDSANAKNRKHKEDAVKGKRKKGQGQAGEASVMGSVEPNTPSVAQSKRNSQEGEDNAP